uniref:Choline transporter-like protein n=1 Tax=Ditylenchus dipsaci TaxID=166011 RepID=A0A915ES93_9BILA
MTQESAIAVHRTKSPTWLRYALMFHVLAFFWINAFLADVQKFVVAYAASTWYFNTNDRRSWSAVYLKAVLFFWRYHLGSLAIGSLLLMLFRVPSHIYLFLNHRVKQSRNALVVGAYRSMSFCLKDVERLMKSIHVNAYAVVAANGEDFLSAGNTAANLWQDNSWYMLTTNTVAALLFTLTKSSFAILIGFCSGCYFRARSDVVYWFLPTVVCIWLAYYVMNRFLSLFEIVIETLFLCYACEIDSDPTIQKSPKMMVKRADFGFNKYMAYRIQEERCLNNSQITPRGYTCT